MFNGPFYVYSSLVDLESLMLYTKIQAHSFLGSREEEFLSVFTIYGHGNHLNKWIVNIFTNFQSLFNRRLHMKFEAQEVQRSCSKVWTDWGMASDHNSSFWAFGSRVSLWLRWARTDLQQKNHFGMVNRNNWYQYFLKKKKKVSYIELWSENLR